MTPTSPVDRTADPETTRAEKRKHQGAVRTSAQAGLPAPAGPDQEVLRARVRAALTGSDFRRLVAQEKTRWRQAQAASRGTGPAVWAAGEHLVIDWCRPGCTCSARCWRSPGCGSCASPTTSAPTPAPPPPTGAGA